MEAYRPGICLGQYRARYIVAEKGLHLACAGGVGFLLTLETELVATSTGWLAVRV